EVGGRAGAHPDGIGEPHAPNPFFDPAWYLERYRVALAPDETPLGHFAREGVRRGHRPGRGFDAWIRFFREDDPAREAAGPLAGWLHVERARRGARAAALPVALPAAASPRVSVVVVHRGAAAWLRATLRALAAAGARVPFEVVIVDDDPAARATRELPAALRVVRNEAPLGDAASRSQG